MEKKEFWLIFIVMQIIWYLLIIIISDIVKSIY